VRRARERLILFSSYSLELILMAKGVVIVVDVH
jgi:hypothetical protein